MAAIARVLPPERISIDVSECVECTVFGGELLTYFPMILNCTRRFAARPASVAFVVMGRVIP